MREKQSNTVRPTVAKRVPRCVSAISLLPLLIPPCPSLRRHKNCPHPFERMSGYALSGEYTNVDYSVFRDAAAFLMQPGARELNRAQGPLAKCVIKWIEFGE